MVLLHNPLRAPDTGARGAVASTSMNEVEAMATSPLLEVLGFIRWADQLKAVLRQSSPIGETRRENSAEHSWHACLAALTLAPILAEDLNLERVLRMLVVHDLVEVTAGDTYVHDEVARRTQDEREAEAAERFIGMLPAPTRGLITECWMEFSALDTREAQFAKAVDAMMAILLNTADGGQVWLVHGTPLEMVHARIDTYVSAFPDLARELHRMVDELDHPEDSTRQGLT